MGNLVLTIISFSIAAFFSGFAAGSEAALLYLYFVHDTGITFTGYVIADIFLLIGFTGFTIHFSRVLWLLNKGIKGARKTNEKRPTTFEA